MNSGTLLVTKLMAPTLAPTPSSTPGMITLPEPTIACRRNVTAPLVTLRYSSGTPAYYQHYLRGEMTHFECLAAYFGSLRCTESELLEVIHTMELEPGLPGLVEQLKSAGWAVVVASAGCAYYIDRLLAAAGVLLPVHASPGRWRGDGLGLEMTLPTDSPFCSVSVGIDKAAVVRDALTRGEVAFAGDGHTDVPAALLVPPHLRFAKDDCANDLRRRGEAFTRFDNWGEVAANLLQHGR